jgi:hypothetical protein
MAEKKSTCGCGCAVKNDVPKANKDQEKAKEAKESK